ncbi:MAG: hypothetical protein JXA01_03685 [Dehalococcoidia bacterium]|nr:hypothetical protein [Dehalococcoidia bacterium]
MSRNIKPEINIEQRSALLAALTRARGDIRISVESSNEADDENNCYYTLTKEQLEALVNGNMEQIEGWVSNLDRRHATWLLSWLIRESV